jgi:predicted MFS family arabinose efflux permease
MVLVLSVSLATALLASFLVLPMARFHAGKCHGVFLLLLYLVTIS